MHHELEELRFRAVFDRSSDAMLVVDNHGRINHANHSAQQLLGHSADELHDLPLEAIIPQRYRDHYRQCLGRLGADRNGGELELFVLTPDGLELPVNIGLCPFEANGESHSLLTLHFNDAESRFRQLAENIQEVFWLTTPDKQEMLYISPAYERIWGRSCASLLACPTSWTEAVVPEDRERVVAAATTRQILGDYDIEYRIGRPDGEVRWIRDRAFPVMNERGQVYRIAGLAEDITQHKESDKAMCYQSYVLGNMDQGVSYTDRQGVIRFTNAAFDAMFGYAQGELIGQHASILNNMSQEEYEHFFNRTAMMQKGVWTGELCNRRKDGSTFDALATIKQLQMADETIWVSIQEDISGRKRMEKELLERRKKLDELQNLQLATHTASAIAHELNQPLFAIATYNEAAIRMLRSGNFDIDRLVHVLDASEQQAQRAGRSIREMLGFLNASAFPVETFDVNQEILNALSIARSDNHMSFKTSLELEQDLPPVRANRIRVQKVLVNLLNNGIEAMEAAGVPAPAITVTVRTMKDRNMAHVSIRDNGPGLSAEDAKRIFEPFYTTKTNGIGVGLAISRSLIEAQGGNLWADAEDDCGAIFHFTIPFAS